MNSVWVLLIGMTASVVTGTLMWWWVRDAMREMLNQLCDKPGSTTFWSRYTLLMLLIAPLAVVVFFAPEYVADATQVLRRVILAILLGHFFAFALVGRSLFKAVSNGTVAKDAITAAEPAKG